MSGAKTHHRSFGFTDVHSAFRGKEAEERNGERDTGRARPPACTADGYRILIKQALARGDTKSRPAQFPENPEIFRELSSFQSDERFPSADGEIEEGSHC